MRRAGGIRRVGLMGRILFADNRRWWNFVDVDGWSPGIIWSRHAEAVSG